MNIQNYILPEWKKEIKNQDIPDNLQEKFVVYGESMAEYLDRFMMRSLPDNWYRGWTRYKFPLHTDDLVLDIHEVIARNFGEYVQKYRKGDKKDFEIRDNEIEAIQELQEAYEKKLREKKDEFQSLRGEIKDLRKTRSERPQKRSEKKREMKKKAQQSSSDQSANDGAKPIQSKNRVPDHDYVYEKWMEMVESKPISKSYWHIHNYLAKYILEFAEENTSDGLVTEQVIEDFLEDYGKGKRPKTMNHYNRVVYRFWEFYENLLKNQDPMEVW